MCVQITTKEVSLLLIDMDGCSCAMSRSTRSPPKRKIEEVVPDSEPEPEIVEKCVHVIVSLPKEVNCVFRPSKGLRTRSSAKESIEKYCFIFRV
jgi:hypothetical protein